MPADNFEPFYADFGKALDDRSAAVFVGAGLSMAPPASMPGWSDLLHGVARELGLDVARETDLISLAQFHHNERQARTLLDQAIRDAYDRDVPPTENHMLIASLPVETVWTTNYDHLIERAFERVGKRRDVKVTDGNFTTAVRGKDVTIYKMHGDVSHPDKAVLTKEDYERYQITRPLFSEALRGDLVQKSFLFLGFSFTDPNIEYVLSRIRALVDRSPKQHYCIMKRPARPAGIRGSRLADYEYDLRRLELRIADLKRYGIRALMVDDYSDITTVLRTLNERAYRNDVFVSGSAHDGAPLGQERLHGLSYAVGRKLIENGYNLVSGLGLGIGSEALRGALHAVYAEANASAGDRVAVRPFPQVRPGDADGRALYSRYREDMIARTGSVVFISGNKLPEGADAAAGPETAGGVMEEFAICRSLGKFVIPVGATGWASRDIWQQVAADPGAFYGAAAASVRPSLGILGDETKSAEQLADAAMAVLRVLHGR